MNSDNSTSSYKHLSDMLQTALPYISPHSRSHMEVLIKTGELMDSISQNNHAELSACDVASSTIDFEGLFQELQKVSNPQETETLNTLLNFCKTQKLYRTYLSMKDFLPAKEGSSFAQKQLLPLIESFFESYQKNREGGLSQ